MPALTDKIDILLDSTGDLDMSAKTDVTLSTGLAAVAQGVRLRVLFFLGEWFADLDKGVDWFGQILGQKYNEARVRNQILTAILDTNDDLEIITLDLEFDNSTRVLEISWNVKVTFTDTEDTFTDSLEVAA